MSEHIHYESLVIGACLQTPELIAETHLQPTDFTGEYHAEIWAACLSLIDKGETPDVVTISETCSAPITMLVDTVRECHSTKPDLVVTWAGIVRNKARRDRLVNGLHALTLDEKDPDTMLGKARDLLLSVESDQPSKPRTISDIINERLDGLEDRFLGKVSPIGLTFGVKDLDDLVYGMRPSELIIMAARPAMGKSALALQAARLNAVAGKRVAFFSLEMDVGELFDRMLCQHARFPAHHYQDPQKADLDFSIFTDAAVSLRDADLHCFDDVFDIEGITARCRSLHTQKPVDLVVVDYLQLVGSRGKSNPNRAIEVGQYSRAFKMLAMSLGCPVLVLSQLNRGVEVRTDKRPLMADLRESGSVEQDANKIIMLYRDEVYDENTQDKGRAELIVRKHRGGMTGIVPSAANLQFFRFDDLARDYQQQQQEANHDPFA